MFVMSDVCPSSARVNAVSLRAARLDTTCNPGIRLELALVSREVAAYLGARRLPQHRGRLCVLAS